MFCPNCRNEVPDGSPACPACGTPVAASAPVAKKSGISTMKLIALVLALVSIAALVISYFVVMDTSFEKIPAVSLIMGDDVKEVKEMKKEIKQAYEDANEVFKEAEDELDKKDAKLLKNALKTIKSLSSSFSINNIRGLAEYVKDLEDIKVDGQYVLDPSVADVGDDITDVLDVISTVVLVFMLVCLAFTALGGFLRINGLVITGLIFSALYALIFCGVLFLILFAVVDIALCVVIAKAKKQAA